jgi:hypothetical protein
MRWHALADREWCAGCDTSPPAAYLNFLLEEERVISHIKVILSGLSGITFPHSHSWPDIRAFVVSIL